MFLYAYSATTIAILSFWLWLFKPSRFSKWLLAFTVPAYMAFMVFFLTDYITWNEGVTDRLADMISFIGMRIRGS